MQDMKAEFNKDIEMLKKLNKNLRNEKLNNSKNSAENLANRLDQQKDRLEDKVEELEHSGKSKDKIIRTYKWNLQYLWDTIKRPNL
jgi:hypothetical protein